MTKEILQHISILTAHLAKEIAILEGIDKKCVSPVDIAIIAHEKRFTQLKLLEKMMNHLAELGYLEKQGEIFTLVEEWRQSLPTKSSSLNSIRELGIHQLYLFQEYLAKYFIDIVRNDIQKLELAKLIYYLETIDSSKGMHAIRSEGISLVDFGRTPKKVFDFNFGFGYSATQIASLYPQSEVYSLQLNPIFSEAYEYTIQRYGQSNLTANTNYPSQMMKELMDEKVDIIYSFNPIGLGNPDLGLVLDIASQIASDGTILLLHVPFTDQPKDTLVAEWLAHCIDSIDSYKDIQHYIVALNKHKFYVKQTKEKSPFIIATFNSDK